MGIALRKLNLIEFQLLLPSINWFVLSVPEWQRGWKFLRNLGGGPCAPIVARFDDSSCGHAKNQSSCSATVVPTIRSVENSCQLSLPSWET